jgi:hypothetical protein
MEYVWLRRLTNHSVETIFRPIYFKVSKQDFSSISVKRVEHNSFKVYLICVISDFLREAGEMGAFLGYCAQS